MRELNIGTKKHTVVTAEDEPGPGGANHQYCVFPATIPRQGDLTAEVAFAIISFQKGPIKEAGVNGIHNEDLIAIVIDRIEGFQNGTTACMENYNALVHLKEALAYLNRRTLRREQTGIEGTSEEPADEHPVNFDAAGAIPPEPKPTEKTDSVTSAVMCAAIAKYNRINLIISKGEAGYESFADVLNNIEKDGIQSWYGDVADENGKERSGLVITSVIIEAPKKNRKNEIK